MSLILLSWRRITRANTGLHAQVGFAWINIVVKDEIGEISRPPLPGTAPWAPLIVHVTPPRWPVIIPLMLLAGLAAGIWLLMNRGLLPSLARLAGWS